MGARTRVLSLSLSLSLLIAGTIRNANAEAIQFDPDQECRLERFDNELRAIWETKLGFTYQIERSIALRQDAWLTDPDTYYGLGSPLTTPVLRTFEVPPPSYPPVSESSNSSSWIVFIDAFSDGSFTAHAIGDEYITAHIDATELPAGGGFLDGGGNPISGGATVNLDSFDTSIHVVISANGSPPAVNSGPEFDDDSLIGFITFSIPTIKDKILNPPAIPDVPPVPPQSFDDFGQPVQHFYRVRKFATDSNYDGTADSTAFENGETNPYNLYDVFSLSNFGVHNAYLMPADGTEFNGTPRFSDPIINEACWSNVEAPASSDGQLYDWIELYNPTFSTQDVSAWTLRYTKGGVVKTSALPSGVTIASGDFLIVFCSSLTNAEAPAGEVHADFKLDVDDPGKIELVKPGGQVADTFGSSPTIDFNSRAGLSFGRHPDKHANGGDYLKWRYFDFPTPEAHNLENAYEGVAPEPRVVDALSGQPVDGGIFYQTTLGVEFDCPSCSDAIVTYTTNCSIPSWRSDALTAGEMLSISASTVVKAVAHKTRWLPSRPVTRSFIFKESVVGTATSGAPTDHQVRPPGYPQWTVGATDADDEDFEIDYSMNPHAIEDNRGVSEQDTSGILYQLTAIPSVAISVPVSDLFDFNSGGIYAGEDKSPREASFEWMDPGNSVYQQENAEVKLTGGSSLEWRNIAKKSLSIKFRKELSLEAKGRFQFDQDPFDPLPYDNGNPPNDHDRLRLRNPSQDSWARYGSTFTTITPEKDSYINNAFYRRLAASMGGFVPRSEWVHVYLNGLYWGLYELVEPVEADVIGQHEFAHEGAVAGTEDDFNEEVYGLAGDDTSHPLDFTDEEEEFYFFDLRFNDFEAFDDPDDPVGNRSAWEWFDSKYDFESYAETFVLTYCLQTRDQNPGNYYAWRRSHPSSDGKIRFFVWDSDIAFVEPPGPFSESLDFSGPTSYIGFNADINLIHNRLRGFPPYQRIFAQCLQDHLIDPSGALHGSNPFNLFDSVKDELGAIIDCEAARWGDATRELWGVESDPPLDPDPGYSKADWEPRISTMRNSILSSQLAEIEPQAKDLGLWPGTQGPEVEVYLPGMIIGVDQPILTPGGVVPDGSTVLLSAPGKTIRYIDEYDELEVVGDPKDTATGRQEASDSSLILIQAPNFMFQYSIKARVYDPTTGYSGLTELWLLIE